MITIRSLLQTLLCLLLLFPTSLLFAQQAKASKNLPSDVQQNIQSRIENGHAPSIVVGIIDKDGPKYYFFGAKTYGGQKVDEHTIYEIGSITKTFTGILLAQLSLEGKIKIDEPAQAYLPEGVKIPTRNGQSITLGQLSDHTSSLARLPTNMTPADLSNPYADYSVEQLYAFLNGYTLPRDIGSEYEYSNLAQGLLGHILALKADKTYEALVVDKIARPLGMSATQIALDEKMKAKLAPGHSEGEQVSNWDLPTLAGAGAIRSSLHDMLRYIGANMGLVKTPLYPAMQLSHKVRHDKPGNGTRVGLGWHISKGAEGDVIWHNGGTGGYRSFAGFVKETGKGVVVLTNSSRGADDIGLHLLNSAAKLAEVKKSALFSVRKAFEAQGAQAALNTYEEIKKDPSDYEFEAQEIEAYLIKVGAMEGPKEIQLEESVLESYVGEYELAPGFTITVTRSGRQLFGQATGQGKFELFAKSPTEFFLKVVEAQVTFSVKDGKVESLTLYQAGQAMPGRKLK